MKRQIRTFACMFLVLVFNYEPVYYQSTFLYCEILSLTSLQVTSDATSQDSKFKIAQLKSQIDQITLEGLENENLLGEANFEELQQTGKRDSCLKFLQEWDEEIKHLKLKLKERKDFS